MIVRIFMLLSLFLYAAPTPAAEFILKSGEHEDFTRIVVTLPNEESGWDFAPSATGYSLTVDDENPKFEYSEVFDRIPRTRLSALATNNAGNGLNFSLACDCKAAASKYENRYVIIDIRASETDLPKGTAQPHTHTLNLNKVSFPNLLQIRKDAVSIDRYLPADPGSNSVGTPLKEQISLAIKQDLLTPSTPASDDKPMDKIFLSQVRSNDTQPSQEVTVPPSQLKVHETTHTQFEAPNLVLRSGTMDRDCPTRDLLNDFGEEAKRSFHSKLGKLRRSAINEHYAFETSAMIELAEFYVSNGFGAEAYELFSTLSDRSIDSDFLKRASVVVDGLQRQAELIPVEYLECGGSVSIFTFLSQKITFPKGLDEEAFLLAFNRLTPALRDQLGPRLVDLLLASDKLDLASRVLDASQRVRQTPSDEQMLSKASLLIADDQFQKAESVLDAIHLSGSETTSMALKKKIEIKEEDQTVPDVETLSLAQSLALEMRDTDVEPEAAGTYLRALILAGNFQEVFALLSNEEQTLDKSTKDTLQSKALVALADYGSSKDFLLIATSMDPQDPTLTLNARKRLAHRFISEGFYNQARDFLAQEFGHQLDDEAKVLRATASFNAHKPHRAAADILGVDTPSARHLRAKILSEIGEHRKSGRLYSDVGAHEEAEKERVLAREWAELGKSKNASFAAFARIHALQSNQTVSDLSEIAAGTQALQQSAEIRTLLSEFILNRSSLVNAPPN
ncbi:hypothetical protein [Shimia sp. SDUM112013]|uniref:hypothetical protein n=1 Tax=Shimia sp. SDUM112013 TaxID=3136160 RepID=UPI0032EAE181